MDILETDGALYNLLPKQLYLFGLKGLQDDLLFQKDPFRISLLGNAVRNNWNIYTLHILILIALILLLNSLIILHLQLSACIFIMNSAKPPI